MRALLIAIGGLGISAGLIVLGLTLDGLPGAVLVMLGFMVAVLAVGVSIANSRTLKQSRKPRLKRTNEGRTTIRGRRNVHRCRQCGDTRELRGHLWVCARCDLGPAVSETT